MGGGVNSSFYYNNNYGGNKMARKIKSFRNKKLIKRAIIEIGDTDEAFEIPIRTLSVTDEREIRFDMDVAIPYEDKIPSVEEIAYLTENDTKFTNRKYPMIRKYKVDSEEYKAEMEKKAKYESLLNVLKYIDMDYEIKKGVTLWDDIGVDKGDWLGVCKFFGDEVGIRDIDIEKIIIEAKSLKGDATYEKMALLQSATGLDLMTILDLASQVVGNKKDESAETVE